MRTETVPGRRWMRGAAVGLALTAACTVLSVACTSSTSHETSAFTAGAADDLTGGGPDDSATPAATTTGAAGPAVPATPAHVVTPLVDAPVPVRVQVPSVRIDAPLDPLHLGSDGVLVAPEHGRAGWYEAGPEPGERGRAVIAGHVDSMTGLDVFANLSRTRPGDRILVSLADGSTLAFAVDSVGVYPKNSFPTARVYGGPRKEAEIRLITCGGPYIKSDGGYQDNVVVFGHLVRRHA